MTSLRVSKDHEPLPSISEPSSPTEEDLARPSAWEDESTATLVSSTWKGKGKQRDDDVDENDDSQRDASTGEYPPMAEEALETRKVEENLKRWETLERQRRKRARESHKAEVSESNSSSFIEDVSRRATRLWTKNQHERGTVGRPHARTSGHAVLKNLDESPLPPEPPSPPNTPGVSATENPFLSRELEQSTTAPVKSASVESLPPTQQGSPFGRPVPETQQPIPLRPPDFSNMGEEARRRPMQMDEDSKAKRWWTEWLCGCREQGEIQAGRTNPME